MNKFFCNVIPSWLLKFWDTLAVTETLFKEVHMVDDIFSIFLSLINTVRAGEGHETLLSGTELKTNQ